jgi:hypothetical protein
MDFHSGSFSDLDACASDVGLTPSTHCSCRSAWHGALLSEGKGHTFESCRVRQVIKDLGPLPIRRKCFGYHMATNYSENDGVLPFPRLGQDATCWHLCRFA